MDVAIISDTHIPSRARRLAGPVRERIQSADHVVHAGDFDSESALADLTDWASSLTAVAGNMDPQVGLPEVATVELGGVEFVVTHGTGSPEGYQRRVTNVAREHATSEDPVVVAGHTHETLDTVRGGVRILNPGSATGAPPATRPTMMTATVGDGDLEVSLVDVESSGTS